MSANDERPDTADTGWYELHCSLVKRRGQPVPTYDEWVAAGRPR